KINSAPGAHPPGARGPISEPIDQDDLSIGLGWGLWMVDGVVDRSLRWRIVGSKRLIRAGGLGDDDLHPAFTDVGRNAPLTGVGPNAPLSDVGPHARKQRWPTSAPRGRWCQAGSMGWTCFAWGSSARSVVHAAGPAFRPLLCGPATGTAGAPRKTSPPHRAQLETRAPTQCRRRAVNRRRRRRAREQEHPSAQDQTAQSSPRYTAYRQRPTKRPGQTTTLWTTAPTKRTPESTPSQPTAPTPTK
ncbi:hypothetical protein SAMN04487818_103333, partial [Actinokineospora terrae]